LIPLVALTLLLASCSKEQAGNGQNVQPVNIRVEVVKPTRMIDAIQVSGTVKAFDDVSLSPEEGGIVKEWKAAKGTFVHKGDVIVVLKDEVIRAGYEAADAQYKLAELNLEKQKSVYDEQGISELQIKSTEYGRDAAKANAELMKARLDRTTIKSPCDGYVDVTIPEVGEYAPPGVPICRVVNTSILKIEAEVPERAAVAVHVGTPTLLTFDAVPGESLKGTVSFVSPTVSAANRTATVEIRLNSVPRHLKPDMIAKVQLLRESKGSALMISENVTQLVDRDRIVVYVERDGKAEERRITIGGRQGNLVEVTDGLKPGDRLIVSGFQKVVNGTPVVVTE
jgi:membrane fusion protein (multidrug efflux system)